MAEHELTHGTRWYRFWRWLARNVVYRPLGGVVAIGADNVPMDGPVLFAPVHFSFLDPPVVACATERSMNFMAKEELFRPPVFGPLIRSLGAFPVRRGENDTEAIKRAITLLQSGAAVLIFPEGQRGDGTTMMPITAGIAMLAKRSQAQVVPVGIVGSHVALGKGSKRLRRQRITVAFGKAVRYSDLATAASEKENRENFANYLAEELARLCTANGLPLKTGQSTLPAPATDAP
jgi:1-acyl-sn-glycerol-3-phosphate acyltransferase